MGILHSSAVQANLMQMCDRSSNGKPSNEGLNSGITCNNCGGIGHYSKNCSSKPKSQGPTAAIKVNMAAAKITTESEYNQYLPETKKQVGKCPACNQAAHTYTRQFPFGKAEWPSIRLESCPQYSAMSSRERGELLEKVKGCYKCTSWKHQGDTCFTRSKACTVVEGGVACVAFWSAIPVGLFACACGSLWGSPGFGQCCLSLCVCMCCLGCVFLRQVPNPWACMPCMPLRKT